MPSIDKFTTHDFNDGAGPVPAHRHLNPDGSLGGWVAETASVAPTCFVGPSAQVFGSAKVEGNAKVYGHARVCQSAVVCGCAEVHEYAEVGDDAKVSNDAAVYGNAKVYGHAKVFGTSEVYDRAKVYGNARVYGNADVCGNARVYGNAKVFGCAEVCDNAKAFGEARVCGNACLSGRARASTDSWTWDDSAPPSMEEQRELAKSILAQVSEHPDSLDMSSWHGACGTSHCIAGWVQAYDGALTARDPYECGVRILPAMAPFFFETRERALEELRKLAGDDEKKVADID